MNKDFIDYLSRRLANGACHCCKEYKKGGPSAKSEECMKCFMAEILPRGCDE